MYILQSLAERLGVPVDHLTFVAVQALAIIAAPLLRKVLHPSRASPSTRHAFMLFVGLLLSTCAYGQNVWLLIGFIVICYVLLRTISHEIVQRVTLFVTLSFLSGLHLQRVFYNDVALTLELTGPVMVMVEKATSLAIFIHDGRKDPEKLSKSQSSNALKEIPTFLEYASYMLQFQTILAGPFILFKDYQEFVTGQHLTKHKSPEHPNEPSPVFAGLRKIALSVLCALIFTLLSPIFPIQRLRDESFLAQSVPHQMMYIIATTTVTRFKYYHAWILAEAICNLSGLGFSGYDAEGKEKWDLVNNVDILGFELAPSQRDCINSWNKGTNVWFRIVVYERVPKSQGVFLTFALSALWHGFFPGYYLTFFTAALTTMASRTVRSSLRPFFLKSLTTKSGYDFLTIVFTRLIIAYSTFSFILLEFWPSVRVFWSMYFWLHFLTVFAIAVLPKFVEQNEARLRNRISKFVTNTNVQYNSLQG